MAEEGVGGIAQKTGSGIADLVTWVLVAVFGFAGYAKPGWPFSFKDIAATVLKWVNIGGAGTEISPDNIANLIAGGITGVIGGMMFAWGYRKSGIMRGFGMVGGAWLLGKAIRHTLAGVGVK
jgi:hypothetical protein